MIVCGMGIRAGGENCRHLNLTGTPSVLLHPAEAMICDQCGNDVVILISNSEKPEITRLRLL